MATASFTQDIQIDTVSVSGRQYPIVVRGMSATVEHTAAGFKFTNVTMTIGNNSNGSYRQKYSSALTRSCYIRSSAGGSNLASWTGTSPVNVYTPFNWNTSYNPSEFTIPAGTSATSCTVYFVWSGASSGVYGSYTFYNLPSYYTAPATPTISGSASNSTTVNVTYGTSSFGYPASGTVYLYGATSATPITVQAQSTTTGNNSYTKSTLIGNTTYYYRSQANNGQRTSDYSQEITITTPCPALDTLEVVTIGETSVTLSYSLAGDGGAYTNRILQYSLNSGDWVELGVASAIGQFTISGLTEGTEYTIKTRLVTTAGNGDEKSVTITSGLPSRLYGSVNGSSKKIKKLYGSVNGETKRIVKLYGSVSGVAKRVI